MPDLDDLRAWAVGNTFISARTPEQAVERLGFVQVDPIRAPAPAQDLILRHRVAGYRAGDLERAYPEHDLEEDVLYAYGVMTLETWRLLHPRAARALSALERRVLDVVREAGPLHPRALAALVESRSVRNDWGGRSKETNSALQRLQRSGLLRVSHRERGARVYAPAHAPGELPAPERLRRLAMTLAAVFAPLLLPTLRRMVSGVGRSLVGPRAGPAVLRDLVSEGALRAFDVDGSTWLWPATRPFPDAPAPTVRMLAPFDPLVHDRGRFERLWGWQYRFEAYTPPARRVRGYYALPVLFGNDVIGWANARVADGALSVDVGFEERPGSESGFDDELAADVQRLAAFLDVEATPPALG